MSGVDCHEIMNDCHPLFGGQGRRLYDGKGIQRKASWTFLRVILIHTIAWHFYIHGITIQHDHNTTYLSSDPEFRLWGQSDPPTCRHDHGTCAHPITVL